MEERREYLLLVVDRLLETHKQWVASDTPYMTEEFEKAVEEAIEVFDSGSVPANCRDLTARVESLAEHWHAYRSQALLSRDSHLLPGNGFWKALEQTREAREGARPQADVALESIADLTRQNVSDRQICLIYGWVDATGQPEIWRLREERAKPGAHTGEGFEPPLRKRRLEREQRQREIVAGIRQQQARKLERLSSKPAESLEKLVADGVSAKQIAKMLGCDVDDVYRRCKELKITPPAEAYDIQPTAESVNAKQVKAQPAAAPIGRAVRLDEQLDAAAAAGGKTDLEQERSDEIADEIDGGEDAKTGDLADSSLEDQVVTLFAQGMPEAEIATELAVTARKVRKIIKQWQSESVESA